MSAPPPPPSGRRTNNAKTPREDDQEDDAVNKKRPRTIVTGGAGEHDFESQRIRSEENDDEGTPRQWIAKLTTGLATDGSYEIDEDSPFNRRDGSEERRFPTTTTTRNAANRSNESSPDLVTETPRGLIKGFMRAADLAGFPTTGSSATTEEFRSTPGSLPGQDFGGPSLSDEQFRQRRRYDIPEEKRKKLLVAKQAKERAAAPGLPRLVVHVASKPRPPPLEPTKEASTKLTPIQEEDIQQQESVPRAISESQFREIFSKLSKPNKLTPGALEELQASLPKFFMRLAKDFVGMAALDGLATHTMSVARLKDIFEEQGLITSSEDFAAHARRLLDREDSDLLAGAARSETERAALGKRNGGDRYT